MRAKIIMENLENQNGNAKHRDRMYAVLKAEIISSGLVPGTFLNEKDLGERYEISRTPIREALLRLQDEGYIERVGRRLVVKLFGLKEVQEIYTYREALEVMAVRLCIENAENNDLNVLSENQKEFDLACYSNAQPEILQSVSNRFHREIARLSGNRWVIKNLDSIYDTIALINKRWWKTKSNYEQSRADHEMILSAILVKDIQLAEALMRHHLRRIPTVYQDQE